MSSILLHRVGAMTRSTNLVKPDMPPGTDSPYPIRILAFFEMIRI